MRVYFNGGPLAGQHDLDMDEEAPLKVRVTWLCDCPETGKPWWRAHLYECIKLGDGYCVLEGKEVRP